MLEQLSRALWSRGTLRGAAVIVGAGFSRGGARLLSDDTLLPPLWTDLARDMARELYGAQSDYEPKDPLRLAEEFRAGLGDAALTDFLRRRVCDDAYEPGPFHRDLLNLPWADVLTTNYDTLLERAAQNSRRGYKTVLAESELAHAGGPRIIKLHGSLQDGASVVISEEDYRTYPERRAAFVNTARQLFIENELCLLGFSGDDPNFLQWAGWVRDRLGGRARRIYLVGALDIPPVKRRLLEARGVAPIDLASAVKGERPDRRHAAAISLFLAYLKATRPVEPHDWEPASYQNYPSLRDNPEAWSRDLRSPDKVVEAFRAVLVKWREDRRTCPRWLVCPSAVRQLINHGTNSVEDPLLALDTLPQAESNEALLELAWRYDRGAQPLPSWLIKRMDMIATSEALNDAEPALVHALVRVLLGAARVADDEGVFADRAGRFEALAMPSDLRALVAHERCLFARDRLDFVYLANNVGKIVGDDPVWGLRRAALMYCVGKMEEALKTINAAVRELRARVLRDPDSVALRSRLAWAKFLTRALSWEDEGTAIAELDGLDWLALGKYDPWEQLHAIDAEVNKGLLKRLEARQIEPGFEAGTYRDNRDTISFGNAINITPLSELRYLAERVGLPIQSLYVNILGTRLADALRLAFEPTVAWHTQLLSTIPSYSGGPIDIHLGRLPVARLDADVVRILRERFELAIGFWRARVHRADNSAHDVSVLRLYIEALSRLTARDDATTAKAHARLALELGSDVGLKHWWLKEPIGHLLKRALAAVPRDERSELSRELLDVPLAAEWRTGGPSPDWHDSAPEAYRFVRRSGNEAIFDARVAELIRHLSDYGSARPEAAIRLLNLYQAGQLTADQAATFADALWRGVSHEESALPEGLKLHPHAFLIAPAPSDINAHARVYANLFSRHDNADPVDLVLAVSGRTPRLRPNEADAQRLFRNVTNWRPAVTDSESIGDAFSRPFRKERDRMMASVLAVVAAPALSREDRTVERAEAALAFLDETELPETLAALPIFYGLNAQIDERIIGAFRRPLAIGDRGATPAAVDAIDRWLRLAEARLVPELPDVLRDRALRALERRRVGGLAHLIYLARRLIEAGRCGNPELERVTEVLDELRAATEYGPPRGDVDVESDWAVSLPLIRAECVRLALALEQKGLGIEPIRVWRDLAARDPLPEIRHASRDAIDE